MRRLSRRVALGVVLVALASPPGGGTAGASGRQDEPPADLPVVDVVQVTGYVDPIVVDFLERSLSDAEQRGALAFVVQLDSPGAVVGGERFDRLVQRVADAGVPVGVWVGPSGAEAAGQVAELVAAGDFRALAPGSRLQIADGDRIGPDDALRTGRTNVGSTCDRERGSTEGCAATLGDFIVSLGVPTREVTRDDGQTRVEPDVRARFRQLSLGDRLMHTVASPPMAYLLVVTGMVLLLFELFTAGIGVAGAVGALAFLLGCFGMGSLPVRPAGLALLGLAMFGYAVDVQTGAPRLWTGIATVSFVTGSVVLYDGVALSWITLGIAVVGITLAMIAGMPAMVRARFSTPTIGREWMIGEDGQASTPLAPEGIVTVRGAPWRARTNRATPIEAGMTVRVASIEGLVLEVEPLEGAARDYRH
ncbi:MAG: NfeD family protein [Acidimicrobiia bacterium]